MGLLGSACSSADKERESGQKAMSDSMASRILSRDTTKRSSFESAMVSKNSGMGSYLEKQGYKSKEYGGTTKYRVPKTLEQGEFSGADEASGLGRKRFQRADEASGLGDAVFKAGEAREGSLAARQQGQMFLEAGDEFKTGAVRDAARSQAENKRPAIVKPNGGHFDETPYTEEEIRRLVNRR